MYKNRIRETYEYLSPGYRRVADFLLESYRDVAFMTAAEVGKATSVDTTLVVRFAQRLGYPGYPELQADVQDDVKQDLRAIYTPAPEDHSPSAAFQRSITEDRNNLLHLLLHVDAEVVDTVVRTLRTAPRIFLAGEGHSAFLAEAFAMRLAVLGLNARSVSSELAEQAASAMNLQAGDAFVGLGMTELTPDVAVILKAARDLGARTIGIVSSLSNPVAAVAEHVLVAPARHTEMLPSLTALAAVLHGLLQMLIAEMGDPAAELLTQTDRLAQAYAEAWRDQVPRVSKAAAAYSTSTAGAE